KQAVCRERRPVASGLRLGQDLRAALGPPARPHPRPGGEAGRPIFQEYFRHSFRGKTMSTDTQAQPSNQIVEILKTVEIAAPIEIAFEAMLEELGPDAQMEDGTPMPFKLETWPGGRWYRDLGNNAGHLWAHVQVIKPPTLLELWGPLMMSY